MAQRFSDFKTGYTSTYNVWASVPGKAADVKNPGTAKVKQGWTIEKPSHATLNFWMNRTDKRVEELEAKVAWLVAQLGYQL